MPILAPIRCAFLNELRILAGSTPQLQQRQGNNNRPVTPSSASLSQMHTYMHIMCTNLQYAKRALQAPQTMQLSIKTLHTLSNIANPSAASYLAPILHIDSAASSQTPSPNDGTSSIVAHQVKPAPNIAEPSPYSSQTPARSPLEIASRHAPLL